MRVDLFVCVRMTVVWGNCQTVPKQRLCSYRRAKCDTDICCSGVVQLFRRRLQF